MMLNCCGGRSGKGGAGVEVPTSKWTLAMLMDAGSEAEVVASLVGRGFDEPAAKDVFEMFQKAAGRLRRNLVAAGTLTDDGAGELNAEAFWVPGRVEVVGKHTDYAGGRSLLGAVTKGFAIVTSSRGDGKVGLYTQFSDDTELSEVLKITSDLAHLQACKDKPTMEGGWAAYPASAIQRLCR